jgi:hypothetical protein
VLAGTGTEDENAHAPAYRPAPARLGRSSAAASRGPPAANRISLGGAGTWTWPRNPRPGLWPARGD